jgi:glucokinase
MSAAGRSAAAPRLLADIGGTNARFALQLGQQLDCVEVLACAEHATLDAALRAYLGRAARRGFAVDAIAHAGLAIANPVDGDLVSMTNHHWQFSIAAQRAASSLSTLLVMNDFAALAMSLPGLRDGQRERIGGGTELGGRTLGLIGPGTGLGVAGVTPAGDNWIVLAGEGGHASFAPNTDAEAAILAALQAEHGHVSAERLLSGAGLEAIHRVLAGETLAAADITRRALAASSAACRDTVDTFCGILGSVAGNVALTLGATGGMYVGGGIVPRLGPLFAQSPFRRRFEDKGRLGAYLARIPTWVITEPYPALQGAGALLAAHIAAQP